MSGQFPFLDVRGPGGSASQFDLVKDRVTIGRLPELNDVALQPDPQRLVTRSAHCTLERDKGSWSVVDNRSANRTYVRRGHVDYAVSGRVPLTDGDVIRVLARVEPDSRSDYWELTFRDPQQTYRFGETPLVTYLHYDATQAKLFRVTETDRREITTLRPQEHRLVRHMDKRNRENGNVPVMCTYDELITAIWGDEVGHTEPEVNHLVWELRQKVEPGAGEAQFLQLVRGLGYRLETR